MLLNIKTLIKTALHQYTPAQAAREQPIAPPLYIFNVFGNARRLNNFLCLESNALCSVFVPASVSSSLLADHPSPPIPSSSPFL